MFPYRPRGCQRELVDAISSTVSNGGHLVLESGTGTGKTVCSLTGALTAARPEGRRVLYLTRTNSQQRQVIHEAREIARFTDVYAAGIQGRKGTCLLIRDDPELMSGGPDELSRLCQERRRRSMAGKRGGCAYFDGTRAADMDALKSRFREEMPTVEEAVSICDDIGVCPYEAMKEAVGSADVVTAPYPFLFVPFIRDRLLDWMGVQLSSLDVIVDEAHNLPEYAREINTMACSARALDAVEREVDDFGDPEVMEGVSVMDVAFEVRSALDVAVSEYLLDEDGLIPPDLLEESLMCGLGAPSTRLSKAWERMRTFGDVVRESRRSEGRLPRSYIHALSSFLSHWAEIEDEAYIKLVIGGDNPALQAYCLDPSLATSVLGRCHSSVHMSGTLSPMEEYRDSIDLPRTTPMRRFPSPFPKANRLCVYDSELTTRHDVLSKDPGMEDRLALAIRTFVNSFEVNTIVFFPSHRMMGALGERVAPMLRRQVMWERRGMSQSELMRTVNEFRSTPGSVMFSVMGGRISEGMDFPGSSLELAILVGVPYPRPTARQRALMHYYDLRFQRGWEYAVKVPAVRRMQQAIGRLIRSEEDRGVAVILDSRAERYSDLLMCHTSDSVLREVTEFLEGATLLSD